MNQLGKYKSIVVSIALFLLLDASVLMLNFYISYEISEDAEGVNVAGRQRMLSQRMVKSLLNIEHNIDQPVQREKALNELAATVKLFDKTLIAFAGGGATVGAGGDKMLLARVSDSKGRAAIVKAQEIWVPYRNMLDRVLTATDTDAMVAQLPGAIVYADQSNLQLLGLMNTLTIALENVASSKASRLRIIQTIGISLAIINFFIIMFHFLRQLKDSDRKIDAARKETTEILDTVGEGLFLIDRDLNIGSQHSKVMKSLFGRDDIASLNFEGLLESIITQKDLDTAKRFVNLLYRPDIKDNLIVDLNPLRRIQVNIGDEMGGFVSKYFSFQFSRVYENAQVKDILATVQDISGQVLLEKELEATRLKNEEQLEVLTSILHANPETLMMFIDNCFSAYARINNLLKEQAKGSDSMRAKLIEISREAHNLKGESGALGLDGYEQLAHGFETALAHVGEQPLIQGDSFLPLVVEFEKLIRYTESIQQLGAKLVSFSEMSDNTQLGQDSHRWQHLYQLTDTVARREGKKVELVALGLSEVVMDHSLSKLVSDVTVQCLRNAIVHGIEIPDERLASNKSPIGRIDVRLARLANGALELTINDDGCGIDLKAIRARALKQKLMSEQELEVADRKQLMSLIFSPGFSTRDQSTLDAGRGFGMDIVREQVKALRGKIRIASRAGVNTQFVISIPPAIAQVAA